MDIKTVLSNKKVVASVSAVAIITGATVGYILWRRRKNEVRQLSLFDYTELPTAYSIELHKEAIQEAINEAVGDESVESVLVEVPIEEVVYEITIAEAKQILGHKIETAQKRITVEHIEPETPPEPFRVFRSKPVIWDQEAELNTRTPSAPYIIHRDEYMADEMDYRQLTVTYYVADDILADEEDTPVYGFQQQMGELKFGHGSEDPNVVYIRNEALKTEWEVLQHPGSFAYEVMGEEFANAVENELKHSVLKFRRE